MASGAAQITTEKEPVSLRAAATVELRIMTEQSRSANSVWGWGQMSWNAEQIRVNSAMVSRIKYGTNSRLVQIRRLNCRNVSCASSRSMCALGPNPDETFVSFRLMMKSSRKMSMLIYHVE
jgi:hypothetical protein